MSAANTPNGPRPPAPVQGTRPSATAVTGAIRKASQSTGANFEYLLATAKVESDLNPNLTMRSSTATGLFQFLEQTWLGVMQSAGRAFGFERYADAITQTKSGTYVVQDPALREEMMRLRKDPATNAAMGGVFTQQNAAVVSKRIGRKPTDGELYIAHFFGPYAASKVIGMAKSNPNANAAELFPAAAAANRPIFYDKQGSARSVAGVYNELVRRYQVARARPTPGLEPAVASAPTPAAVPGAPLALTPPGLSTQRMSAQGVAPPSIPAPVRDTAGTTAAFAAANGQPSRAARERVSPDPVARLAPTTAAPVPAFRPMTRPERTSMQRIPPPIAPAPVSDPAGITAAFAAANGLPSPIASGRALPDPIVRPGSAAVSAPAFRPATRSESASVFHSLFDTDGDRGPLSPAVAELWGAPAARARAQDAAGLPALSTPGPVEDAGAPLDLQPAIRPTTRRLLGGGRI